MMVDRNEPAAAPAEEHIAELEREVEHLSYALESRIVIEQAKGILAERLGLSIEEAFEVLRYGARSTRANIHEVARSVVDEPSTPSAIVIGIARSQRIHSAWLRDIAETHRAHVQELHRVVAETVERLDPRRP